MGALIVRRGTRNRLSHNTDTAKEQMLSIIQLACDDDTFRIPISALSISTATDAAYLSVFVYVVNDCAACTTILFDVVFISPYRINF